MGSQDDDKDPNRAVEIIRSNIRRLREERSWTQEELAFASELSRGFLSRLETQGRNLSVVKLFAVADALEVDPRELLRPRSEWEDEA